MIRISLAAALLCGAFVCAPALAGDPAAAPQVTSSAPPAAAPAPPAQATLPVACCVVPAGTIVTVEIVDALDARKVKSGDQFKIRLVEPVLIGGATIVPAGAAGVGEVIDAKPPGFAGRPARLILAARYLESGGVRLPLQSFKLGGAGEDNTKAAAVVTVAVGVIGLAVPGGDVAFPAGTRATAKIAADTKTAPLPAAPSSATTPTPQENIK